MTEPNKIDRLLTGEPLPIGNRTLQPVARLSGWAGGQGSPQGGGGGGWVQLRPVEVIVRAADGAESRVPVVNANAQATRGMVMAGLAVAGICAAIIAIRGLMPCNK
jgi:uncharacterized spore protein YtfJ